MTDLHMPSGSEVESARLHPPHEPGLREKLDTFKSRAISSARTRATSQATKVQDSMRTNPVKWIGIAAGTGFALGMIGRIAQVRNRRRRELPALVIVEASC